MKTKNSPQLGIFWLVKDRLVVEGSPLKDAEDYGDHKTFAGSHIEVWKRLQLQGRVPRESEYEEFPRGRVMFHPSSGEFTLLADRCILKHKTVVEQIKKAYDLPRRTKVGTDPHYRCFRCLYGVDENEADDDA